MIIGIDFDNTIVCYDSLFYRVACERNLIPADVPAKKDSIRDYLRSINREDDWTELQGYVYGARMQEAEPFPGVKEFFVKCNARGIRLYIVSHKTRHPYMGPKYDLHQAAREWLIQQDFFAQDYIGLSEDQAFFELTKQDKLHRIGSLNCHYFIDDLPEFLLEPTFPSSVTRILFDPASRHQSGHNFLRAVSWENMEAVIKWE